VSLQAEEEWLRKRLTYSITEVNLAVCRKQNSGHIGNIYLRDIDWIARHADLHIFIAEPADRGKGYGFAAMQLLIRHAFDDLGLRRIHLRVLEDNESAIRLYKRCGFQVEGVLRGHAYKNGQWRNVLAMGLCSGDVPLDKQ